jgi:CrcB protein
VRILIGYIIVFFGAGIGGMLRHAANRTGLHFGLAVPWTTFFVNVTGSLAIGLIAGWFAFRGQGGQSLQMFLTTGILGGYTTFSAFSLEAALLGQRGQVWGSTLYAAGSVLLSIAGVFLGLAVMRQLSG